MFYNADCQSVSKKLRLPYVTCKKYLSELISMGWLKQSGNNLQVCQRSIYEEYTKTQRIWHCEFRVISRYKNLIATVKSIRKIIFDIHGGQCCAMRRLYDHRKVTTEDERKTAARMMMYMEPSEQSFDACQGYGGHNWTQTQKNIGQNLLGLSQSSVSRLTRQWESKYGLKIERRRIFIQKCSGIKEFIQARKISGDYSLMFFHGGIYKQLSNVYES